MKGQYTVRLTPYRRKLNPTIKISPLTYYCPNDFSSLKIFVESLLPYSGKQLKTLDLSKIDLPAESAELGQLLTLLGNYRQRLSSVERIDFGNTALTKRNTGKLIKNFPLLETLNYVPRKPQYSPIYSKHNLISEFILRRTKTFRDFMLKYTPDSLAKINIANIPTDEKSLAEIKLVLLACSSKLTNNVQINFNSQTDKSYLLDLQQKLPDTIITADNMLLDYVPPAKRNMETILNTMSAHVSRYGDRTGIGRIGF